MQKGSKHFDDIMKNKLEGLSVDASPSDWIMMERMLEWEGLTKDFEVTDETRFDEIAHDKLNNIPANGLLTPDWNRMSAMIDDMNTDPSMEPSEFDQAIDNRLKGNAVPLDMSLWNQLEPILDADRVAVVEDLDAIAKDKLTSVSEIEPAWGPMNAKINRELFLPESIVKYKVIEVALILLFAISASQLPLTKITDKLADNPIASEEQYVSATEAAIAPIALEEVSSEEISIVTAVVDPVTLSSLVSEEPTATVDQATKRTISPFEFMTAMWSLPPTIGELLEELKAKPRFSISEFVFNQVLDPIDMPIYSNLPSIFELKGTAIGKEVDFKQFDAKIIASKDIDQIGGVGINFVEHAIARPFVDRSDLSLQKSQIGLMLGVFSGSDYNEIITPFDPLLAKEGTSFWNTGYAGGVSLGMRFKQWELETGAIYSSNQYQPQTFVVSGNITTGYSSISLTDIELDIVKVPLNFRFNVNLWDKWKVYALSGATMNMVVQSEFIAEETFYGTKTFTSPANPVTQNSAISKKDFGEGILEGGSFKDNSFFTANLGFGVERTIGDKWSIFAQPTYQRQIFSNGIGPNQDRYNAISLYLGTRVALTSKSKVKN